MIRLILALVCGALVAWGNTVFAETASCPFKAPVKEIKEEKAASPCCPEMSKQTVSDQTQQIQAKPAVPIVSVTEE